MSKDLRLNVVDGIYHVTSRGNRKCNVFEDDRDRVRFTEILQEVTIRYGVGVFAEVRLGNHYHQVVQTPRANLPDFMRDLNRNYSRYSNFRHHRIGHVFNEPYRPTWIDGTFHLRVALGYVVMNPVKHGFVDAPEKWRWSSYRATVGLAAAPEYLDLRWLDTAFPAPSRAGSIALFRDYLTAPTWTVAEELLTKPVAGSTLFEREARKHIGATMFMARLPKSYRAVGRPPLEELFATPMSKEERNTQMLRAHVIHAYTMSDVARALSMHPASVSRIIVALRKKGSSC